MRRRGLLAAASSLLLACASSAPSSGVVAEGARRRVLGPTRFGWLSSRQASGALPSAIALGAEPAGRVLLFFEFDSAAEPSRLLRAELLLHTAGPPGQSVDVEVSRAEAARGELRAWADQPRALFPRRAARLASAAAPARIDVTELLLAETTPGAPIRLLLRAEPRGDEPILVQTGVAGGAAPLLEAYWE